MHFQSFPHLNTTQECPRLAEAPAWWHLEPGQVQGAQVAQASLGLAVLWMVSVVLNDYKRGWARC